MKYLAVLAALLGSTSAFVAPQVRSSSIYKMPVALTWVAILLASSVQISVVC